MIEVLNKTHRASLYNKVNNCILDPNSFAYQSSKRQGYSQRLYFEYLYTQKVQGSAFFYTLTYNDKSIPVYPFLHDEPPCFCYDHVRYVTNGILSKTLERQYGSRLRYFCACETGEGKGKRGLGRNPHYHFIFFVQPIHKDGVPVYTDYKPISPLEFRKIIRKVWQGTDDYIDYNKAKFGIVKEGDNCGLVTGVAPFKYVSKYVLKENNELQLQKRILESWRNYYKNQSITLDVLYYFYRYNSELLQEPCHNFWDYFYLGKYNKWRKMTTDPDKSYFRYASKYGDLDCKVRLTELNEFFTEIYLHMLPVMRLREYINQYSGKVRCSKGLGVYGLNFVRFKETNPVFFLPDHDDFDPQTISQYYYRKLYYDKYTCDVSGNVLYRLNDLGIQLKLNSLENRLKGISTKVSEAFDIVHSRTIDTVSYRGFKEFRDNPLLVTLQNSPNYSDLLQRYAIYKTVYEHRNYNVYDCFALDPCFSLEQVKCDYKRFIQNDSYFFDYEQGTIYQKLYFNRSWYSFDKHDCIKPYIPLFKVIDEMLYSVSLFRSNSAKHLFDENKQRSKRVNSHLNS